MPISIHAALHSATAAAAHLRSLLRELAAAVAQGDEAAIAHHARALVQSSDAQIAMASDAASRSSNPHEEGGDEP